MHTKHRIQNFVRWHNQTLNAPAPKATIVAMLADKHDGTLEGEFSKLLFGSFNQSVDEAVEAGLIRHVTHDFLPNGYATNGNPS